MSERAVRGLSHGSLGAEGTTKSRYDEICAIALRQIHQRGFHAVSLRDIASEAGMHVSSLYNYFSSKDKLLSTLTLAALDEFSACVIDSWQEDETPVERLKQLIESDVLFHLENPEKGNVIVTEVRSLVKGPDRDEIRARIKTFEYRVMELLSHGVERGDFQVPDVRLAAYLITTSCARTAAWYRPGGKLSKVAIAEMFSEMLIRSVSNPRASKNGAFA